MNQIDELVAQAVKRKVRNKKDIESFANVLHDMQTTLKPWVSRFKKALSTESTGSENHLETCLANLKIAPTVNKDKSKVPESPKFDFLVSSSPLVSWRADHASEGSRNLFLLTPPPGPTPFASGLKTSSKPVLEKITFNIVTGEPVSTASFSPEKSEKKNDIFLDSTPYLKMSPPKSCILLEPPSVGCTKNPTMPHPVGGGGSGESESSSIQPSTDLALRYPEFFGIRTAHKVGNTRRVVESSPNWYISPPKSCVLLEPSDDHIKNVDMNVPKAGGFTSGVACNKAVIDSTPMCKDLDTTILKRKSAGENTLKEELWTRFEAATAHGFHLKVSVDKEIGKKEGKGFMDLLEEASCNDTIF